MAEKAEELITREEKIAQAKELYGRGSRNYLVKAYEEAADDLSQVCSLYSELYGDLSNELGMPYLLYAKSLIALALEENKVIDVPDEEDEDEEEADGDENEEGEDAKKVDEKSDNKAVDDEKKVDAEKTVDDKKEKKEKDDKGKIQEDKVETTSTEKDEEKTVDDDDSKKKQASTVNGATQNEAKPGTSNGAVEGDDTAQENDEEGDEAATNLQVAWETLELAAKIFKNQGESALPNLAEVYAELANIEFENNIMQSARDDYNKALEIYKQLSSNYRRPMAEINYKIGLSYLMEQASKESAEFLKKACSILDEEINEMKNLKNPTEKQTLNLQDMEETKQEIWVKITEIEESMQQCISEVRAAIQNHMNPKENPEHGESSAGGSSSLEKPKPTDISHLIKRKKPDTATSDGDMSPAKRPAT